MSIFNKPVRWNQNGIACDNCNLFMVPDSSMACLCKACHTPNLTSILYESILSDDNEFSLLYETNCNNENSHYTSFNDSLSAINSPLALSSPRQNGNNKNDKLNKI